MCLVVKEDRRTGRWTPRRGRLVAIDRPRNHTSTVYHDDGDGSVRYAQVNVGMILGWGVKPGTFFGGLSRQRNERSRRVAPRD